MRVARFRASAQGNSAWLEPRAVTGWRKRARRSQVAVKCLISLKTTGEQVTILSPVARGELERLADREGEWQMEKHSGPGAPRQQIFCQRARQRGALTGGST